MLAIVTGATSGIGNAFAEELACRGYDLLLTGRREALTDEANRIRASYDVSVETIFGDLAAAETEERVIGAIKSAPVDMLINNAGSALATNFAFADPGILEQLWQILAAVPSRLIHAALPAMIEAGGGTIINVGSLAGRVPVPGSSVYVAAKSYLERLSETLALELYAQRIVVQALIPGYVRTDFHRSVPDYKQKQRNRGAIRWMEPGRLASVSLRAADRAQARLIRGAGIPRPRDVVVITGMMNRLLNRISHVVPRRMLYKAVIHRKRLT